MSTRVLYGSSKNKSVKEQHQKLADLNNYDFHRTFFLLNVHILFVLFGCLVQNRQNGIYSIEGYPKFGFISQSMVKQ
jgi:hypothetical protein